MSLTSFFKGLTVLVTGDRGLLGRNVMAIAKDAGIQTIGVNFDVVNLMNERKTKEFIYDNKPDLVIHLAGRVSGIKSNNLHPAMHLIDNARISLNVVEACMYRKTPIVAAGSVCAYPRNPPIPTIEKNLWNGEPEETNLAYGASKRFLYNLLRASAKEHGMPYYYILQGNLYGPGDEFNPEISHVIPGLIWKIQRAIDLKEDFITVWGTGRPSRDFCYAKDAAEAYWLAGARVLDQSLAGRGQCVANVASGQEVTISYLAEIIKSLMGWQGRIVYDDTMPDGEKRRCWRIDVAKEEFGWTPKTHITDGLRETIAWYRTEYPLRTYHSSY